MNKKTSVNQTHGSSNWNILIYEFCDLSRLYFWGSIIFTTLILSACNTAKKDVREGFIPDVSVLEQKLDSLFGSVYDSNSPGAAVLIMYHGEEVIKKGYGLRDLKTKTRITPSTNMRGGSLTKQFIALGILSLMEEGKLAITDTVYRFFPYPIFRHVTIKQFIGHTSGIADADWVYERDGWNKSPYLQNSDILEWYSLNDEIRFPPGTAFEYNNGTYVVLAEVIRKVSGMPLEEYMTEKVFKRAGMLQTRFIDDADSPKIPEYAFRYEKDSLGQWQSVERHYLDEELGAGGIYINLNDYASYHEALREKRILLPETHDLIFEPLSMDIQLHEEDLRMLKGKESYYAMGWEVTDSLALSAGLWNGTNNFVIYDRTRPLTIVLFANNGELFGQKLVDKTYDIVREHFGKSINYDKLFHHEDKLQ